MSGPAVPVDVHDAARWLADQPLTLPSHVADRLDVLLAYVLGHRTRQPMPTGDAFLEAYYTPELLSEETTRG